MAISVTKSLGGKWSRENTYPYATPAKGIQNPDEERCFAVPEPGGRERFHALTNNPRSVFEAIGSISSENESLSD